jgi:hypothetical protein
MKASANRETKPNDALLMTILRNSSQREIVQLTAFGNQTVVID